GELLARCDGEVGELVEGHAAAVEAVPDLADAVGRLAVERGGEVLARRVVEGGGAGRHGLRVTTTGGAAGSSLCAWVRTRPSRICPSRSSPARRTTTTTTAACSPAGCAPPCSGPPTAWSPTWRSCSASPPPIRLPASSDSRVSPG